MGHHGESHEYDVFKDSLLRYLGYTNEIGEAFRALIPKSLVNATYVVAFAYALGDGIDKGIKAQKKYSDSPSKNFDVANATIDTFLWQFFASVTIPAFAVNRTVKLTSTLLQKSNLGPGPMKWIPTFVGLGVIPALPYIIDPAVDKLLDVSSRPIMQSLRAKLVTEVPTTEVKKLE